MNEFDTNNNINPQPEDQFAGQQPSANVPQQDNPYMGYQTQYSSGPAMGGFSPEQAMARANDYSPQTGYNPQGSYPDQGFQQAGYQQTGYQQQNYNPQGGFNSRLSYTDPQSVPQNIPQNPNPEATGKKHIIQISIILAAFLLIALCVVSIFMNWGGGTVQTVRWPRVCK